MYQQKSILTLKDLDEISTNPYSIIMANHCLANIFELLKCLQFKTIAFAESVSKCFHDKNQLPPKREIALLFLASWNLQL